MFKCYLKYNNNFRHNNLNSTLIYFRSDTVRGLLVAFIEFVFTLRDVVC